jgi:hypothetical protein
LSALLKYTLQKINYALLPSTTQSSWHYSLPEHPRRQPEPHYSWTAADPDALVVGDFSIQLSPIDRSFRQ